MIAEVVDLSGKWTGLTILLVVVVSVVHLLSRDPRKLRHGILEGMCLPRFLSALESANFPVIDRTSHVFVCVRVLAVIAHEQVPYSLLRSFTACSLCIVLRYAEQPLAMLKMPWTLSSHGS